MTATPIRRVAEKGLRQQTRGDIELTLAERISSSSRDVDALRIVVVTASRHHTEEDLIECGVRAAHRLLDIEYESGSSSFVESAEIIEACFPTRRDLTDRILGMYTHAKK